MCKEAYHSMRPLDPHRGYRCPSVSNGPIPVKLMGQMHLSQRGYLHVASSSSRSFTGSFRAKGLLDGLLNTNSLSCEFFLLHMGSLNCSSVACKKGSQYSYKRVYPSPGSIFSMQGLLTPTPVWDNAKR